MTYEEAIEKISEYVKFGNKLGLERMEKLMALLGDPQEDMKVVHVAGTNGKGSVCRYIYEMLLANGCSAGLYTSPFLERFTERIEANGREITKSELSECAEEVINKAQILLRQGFESPTEFEIVTAIGFLYFKKKAVKVLVLEVGLGGRGDATNIVKSPLVGVITSISFDHTEYLGDTVEKIASEKAGIVKKGIPVISQVSDEKAAEAIKKVCSEKNADFFDVSGYKVRNLIQAEDSYKFGFGVAAESQRAKRLTLDFDDVVIRMIGKHQIANSITALCTMKILHEMYKFDMQPVKTLSGLKNAIQKGRFEILKTNPSVIIDGAHNEAGAEALNAVMKEHFSEKKVLTVIGVLQDKITEGMVKKIAEFTDSFIATEPVSVRRLEAAQLSKKLLLTGKQCESIPDYKAAVNSAMQKCREYDVVLFAGSLYLIGSVRGEILKYKN